MKTFSFNLLPQKTKEQIVKEDKRDQTSLYTAIFPLLATLIWLSIVVYNGTFLQKQIADLQNSIAEKNDKIERQYLPLRIQHGELVIKTSALSTLIQKDIKPESLFILTEKIFPVTDPDIVIIGYGRYADGTFNITIGVPNFKKLAEVTRRFSNFEATTNIRISSATKIDNQDQVRAIINFNLNTDKLADDTSE